MFEDGYIDLTLRTGEAGRIELADPDSGSFLMGHPQILVDLLNASAKANRWNEVLSDARFTLLDKASDFLRRAGGEVVVHWPTTHLDETLPEGAVW